MPVISETIRLGAAVALVSGLGPPIHVVNRHRLGGNLLFCPPSVFVRWSLSISRLCFLVTFYVIDPTVIEAIWARANKERNRTSEQIDKVGQQAGRRTYHVHLGVVTLLDQPRPPCIPNPPRIPIMGGRVICPTRIKTLLVQEWARFARETMPSDSGRRWQKRWNWWRLKRSSWPWRGSSWHERKSYWSENR